KIPIVKPGIGELLFVKFIVDLSDDFFEDIFEGDNSRIPAVFIHDDGEVHLEFLKFAEQVIDFFAFRNKISFTDQQLPSKRRIIFLIEMRKKVFDVQYACYAVE